MKREINPQDTTRAYAFEMWMSAHAARFLSLIQEEIDTITIKIKRK